MRGAYLPGDRSVDMRDVPQPHPGPGQVLVEMRASGICGSDLRAIYREHLGTGPEAYRDVIAGHEPCGVIVEAGPDCRRFGVGDRVVLYHIAGCGLCADCRSGYMISCTSPLRAAYGWQRDGGHADYLLAEEPTCVALPEPLTFVDGACVACGFDTAYEALCRAGVSGRDAVLVTGLGPVGLAAGLLAGALGSSCASGSTLSAQDGIWPWPWAPSMSPFRPMRGRPTPCGPRREATDVRLPSTARARAPVGARRCWAHVGGVGACWWARGGRLEMDASPVLIHRQVGVLGSWVTSVGRMEELVERLVRWELHPEGVVTNRFPLEGTGDAYAAADEASGGKIVL